MNDIFTRRGIKLGFLFGGVAVIFNLVLGLINTFIPFLICITWILSVFAWLVLFVGGYVNGYAEGFSKENMANNLKKSVGAGLCAALIIGFLGGLITIVLSLFPRTVSYLGYSYTYSDFTILGSILTFLGQMFTALVSGIFWFVVGGLAYAYYPVSKLPSNVVGYLDKVKSFATR